MQYTIGYYEDFSKSWQMSDEDYNTLDDALAYVFGLGKDDWACWKKFKIYRGSSSENRWSTFMELSYKYGQLCITKIIA